MIVRRPLRSGEGASVGFLRRLLGAGSSSHNLALTATWFDRIRDAATLQVVGEAHRQRNVASARPPGPDELPPGLPPPPAGYFKALLIPEPSNQYDPNAIGVLLWAGRNWSLAGYLSRENAVDYQPLFRYLSAGHPGEQIAVACDAARVPERDGLGVILHLGTPAECIVELATKERSPSADHPWVGKAVVFTGQATTTIHGVPVDRFAQLAIARWAGCDVLPRLTKKTDALIVADPDELTANLRRAKDYGVAVVQEPDFLATVGIPSDAIGRVSGRWARGWN